MIYRKAYRGQCEPDDIASWLNTQKGNIEKYIKNNEVMTLSIFSWGKNLFLYYECIDCNIGPYKFFKNMDGYLKPWPGEKEERYWVPMYDIFHYNRPVDAEHWKRKVSPKIAVGRLARIKPEMLSGYIFNHYQYQEEKPGDGDKYGIINLHENLLFFYTETPTEEEPSMYEGKLKTRNKPEDWAAAMEPHFIFWEDTCEDEKWWRNTKKLISL